MPWDISNSGNRPLGVAVSDDKTVSLSPRGGRAVISDEERQFSTVLELESRGVITLREHGKLATASKAPASPTDEKAAAAEKKKEVAGG